MKQRRPRGSFQLTAEDIKSFRSKTESARAIGKRKGGVASSLVVYHLRKLNDPEIDALLVLNANSASNDFVSNRLANVERMLKSGRSVAEIVDVCHVSSSTVTRVRRKLGLYSQARSRAKENAEQVEAPAGWRGLIANVAGTPVFKLLTKPWPVELEYTEPTEQAA